jgi:hypothetical protein
MCGIAFYRSQIESVLQLLEPVGIDVDYRDVVRFGDEIFCD